MAHARHIMWDLYEEHLDEAAFLWGQWERSLDAANYTLDEVIDGPEERLRAHLDGLVLGGRPVADKLLIPALADEDEDEGKVTAAAWALLHAEGADHLDLVFEALVRAQKRETRQALGRAFELAERPDLGARLRPFLEGSAAPVQATIVNVLSARRPAASPAQPPAWGFPLETFLESRHQELQAAALRALCRTPDPVVARYGEKSLVSPYVVIRDVAIEAGIRLGLAAARTACSKLVGRNAAGSRLALAVLAAGGEPVDVAIVIRKLEVETMRCDALWALAFAGTAQAAEAALAWTGHEAVDALAADAFATITGARIGGALAKPGPAKQDTPPDDDGPLPVVSPESSLPSPNAERLRAWWNQAGTRFAPGTRYLFGQPMSPAVLRAALASGPTWRRRAWNIDLAMQGAGAPVETSRWARSARAALARVIT